MTTELAFTLARGRESEARPRGAVAVFVGMALWGAALLLAYLLGHDWLEGPLQGNDSSNAVTQLAYLRRWAPPIPGWFHAQGGGVYFLKNYAPGAFIPLWAIGDFLPLTVVQLYRMAAFLTIPVATFGVALLAWRWTGRLLTAALAIALYLASSMTWGWLTSWGFYAQMVAQAIAPFAMLALDAYLVRGGLRRLAVASAVAAAMGVAHPVSGFIFVGIAPGLAIARAYAARGGVLKSLGRAGAVMLGSFGLGAAFWVPFFVSFGRSTERGLAFLAAHQLPYLSVQQLAGLPSAEETRNATTFHPVVAALFLLGLVAGALARRRLVLALGTFAGLCLLYATLPTFAPTAALEAIAPVYSATNVRAVLPAMLLVPIVAAQGLVGALGGAATRGHPRLAPLGRMLAVVGASAAIVLSGHGGPYYGSDDGLARAARPGFRLDDAPVASSFPLERIVRDLDLDARSRIDVSPRLGRVIASLNAVTDASQVDLYFFQASLLHAMWGYEQQVLYDGHDPEQVRNLVDWFGIEQLLLHPEVDRREPLERAGLVPAAGWDVEGQPSIVRYRVPDARGIVTVTRGPAVLVIGDEAKGAYESVFRTGAPAGLAYKDALLVDGGERVDAYDVATLRNFDALFLYGYHFGDWGKGWATLRKYVEEGGNVFLDTGWQYASDDWRAKELPAPAPVASTEWVERSEWAFEPSADPLLDGVDLAAFGPARYGDAGWGISTGPLRERATSVLKSGDRPVLARLRVGRGTVIWSGMNLLGHERVYGSPADARLLANIVREVAGARGTERRPDWRRARPDRDEIALAADDASAWVLFREAAVPEWRADLDGRELRVWKAGPGFVALRLPSDLRPTTLVLEQRTGPELLLGAAVTLASALALLALALRPGLGHALAERVERRARRILAEPDEE